MKAKTNERALAMRLRKQGKSYGEILKVIKVSQSSLTLWLKGIELTSSQKKRLSDKKITDSLKGATMRKQDRIARETKIIRKSSQEIKKLTAREKLLIGAALYWAEGAKQKPYNVAVRVSFANSDPMMIQIFIAWLAIICNVKSRDLVYELYIHDSANVDLAVNYWNKLLKLKSGNLKVRFKQHKLKSLRKNSGGNYFGLIKVNVRRSTDLNRQIKGWTQGIINNWGVV